MVLPTDTTQGKGRCSDVHTAGAPCDSKHLTALGPGAPRLHYRQISRALSISCNLSHPITGTERSFSMKKSQLTFYTQIGPSSHRGHTCGTSPELRFVSSQLILSWFARTLFPFLDQIHPSLHGGLPVACRQASLCVFSPDPLIVRKNSLPVLGPDPPIVILIRGDMPLQAQDFCCTGSLPLLQGKKKEKKHSLQLVKTGLPVAGLFADHGRVS